MKDNLKNIYRKYFKKSITKLKLINNTSFNFGDKKQCYICKKKFGRFGKFRNGSKDITDYIDRLHVVGSDVDNFRCYFCGCHDRVRHLFMYFDKINFWKKFNNAKILHIAPEIELMNKIKEFNPKEYVLGDLNPYNSSFKKIDVTLIPYEDAYFDVLICNHVLEHVPDYLKALNEIKRVLKPNAAAILQIPYSLLLEKNFEDNGINSNSLRLFFYDQEDHVRVFSKKNFINDLEQLGFRLDILEHNKLFDSEEFKIYGVNKEEDLILVYRS